MTDPLSDILNGGRSREAHHRDKESISLRENWRIVQSAEQLSGL
jgi:hypothetical protein